MTNKFKMLSVPATLLLLGAAPFAAFGCAATTYTPAGLPAVITVCATKDPGYGSNDDGSRTYRGVNDISRPAELPRGSGPNTAARERTAKPDRENSNVASGDCSGADPSPKTKRPVVIATGEKFLQQNDFIHEALQPLSLGRTYRAHQAAGNAPGVFGKHWNSSLEFARMTSMRWASCAAKIGGRCMPDWIRVQFPGGSSETYYLVGYPGENTTAVFFPTGNFKVDGGVKQGGAMGFIVANATSFQLRMTDKIHEFNIDYILKSIYEIGKPDQPEYTFTHTNNNIDTITTRTGAKVKFTFGPQTAGLPSQVETITAPDQGQWRYAYDSNRNLKTVTPPSGTGVYTYHYEDTDPTLLTGYSLDGVRITSYSYDANRRVKKSGFENNEEFESFEYETNATIVKNARGSETRYDFEPSGIGQGKRLVKTTGAITSSCPAASVSEIKYDVNGYIDYTLDKNGNKTDYQYDAIGNLISRTVAAGTASALTETNNFSTTASSPNPEIQSTEFSDASGVASRKIEYTYVDSGLAKKWVKSQKITDLATMSQMLTTYEYAFHANSSLATSKIIRTLPDGTATTTRSYNTEGYLVSVTNPLNHVVTWSEHDSLGRARRMVDANGIPTTFELDVRGNVKSATSAFPEGAFAVNYDYDNASRLTGAHFPDGSAISRKYNTAGRLIESGNVQGQVSTDTVDTASQIYESSSTRQVPSFSGGALSAATDGIFKSSLQLDSEGRPWKKPGNNGQHISYEYDANGNVKTATNAANRTTKYTYDAMDRVRTITMADGGIIKYDYDAQGNLQYVTDQRSLKTEYAYDGFGNRTKQISPDTGTSVYIYDIAGRMKSETRNNGKTINFSWDALDRLRTRTIGEIAHAYNYDAGTYGIGQLTSITDPTGSTGYTYSAAGKLLQQTNVIFGKIYSTLWSYDSAGRLETMTYPTGLVVKYGYDGYGRLKVVKRVVN